MKIGIDARLLSRQITGIGRYTLEICRALSKNENVSLYLYSPAPVCVEFEVGLENTKIRTGNWENGLLRQIWSESYLPLWAKQDEIDVFWGPAHRLPRWLPKNIPRVVTIHDLVWKYAGDTMHPISRWLECFQMPPAVKSADEIVADSQATAEAVRKEFLVNSNKISVITLGSSLNESTTAYTTVQKLGIERPYFLFVGTLEPRKNLIRLLTAYSQLVKNLKENTMLVIVGGKGWGDVSINDTVANLDLLNNVCVLGYIDESSLTALYKNALFLAMPSLYEGFGLPLVEAMKYGTPVLTSNNSSMPEVAGDAGLLVDALDVNSIRAGLTEMISNSQLREQLASKAKDVASIYDWTVSAEKLISVFEKVIAIRKSII